MIKTLQTATIKRFMNDEELAAFYEKYKANATATRVLRKADATDLQVFADFKGGATIGALAKKYNKSDTVIRTCIVVASIA